MILLLREVEMMKFVKSMMSAESIHIVKILAGRKYFLLLMMLGKSKIIIFDCLYLLRFDRVDISQVVMEIDSAFLARRIASN